MLPVAELLNERPVGLLKQTEGNSTGSTPTPGTIVTLERENTAVQVEGHRQVGAY